MDILVKNTKILKDVTDNTHRGPGDIGQEFNSKKLALNVTLY